MTLKKLNKSDYITSKTYKSIALLNILKKVMKSIMNKKITFLTKIYRLLLDAQMSARKSKSTETILKLLTKQIHIVWDQSEDKIIILLSINVTRVFDTMSYEKLIHNLRKRKISKWIIKWIDSFLRDRTIILFINRTVIEQFAMQMSISQKSLISLILYLFYNADLLEMCARLDINTKFLRFANDVNILTYDKSIKENCRILKRIHKLCEKWARWHDFVFASTKYEFIHLIRNSKKFNMKIIIDITNNIIRSNIDIQVLNLQIDTKLKWDSHVRKIQKKMIKQSTILFKISTFIWEAIFSKTRIMYIFVVQSIIIYVSSIWHTLKEEKKKSNISNKLAIMQNKCLRTIIEVFRVTFVLVLETKTFIAFIKMHLNQLQIIIKYRLRIENQVKYIQKTCKVIINKLRDRASKSKKHRLISNELKHTWTQKQLSTI
jgi:hypothetical protein